MINGFFELSSNRRDVWQAGVDMTGDGRTRAEWNLSLMRDVIAPSYVRLLMRLRDSLGFSQLYQSLWPSTKVPAPWNQLVASTLQACANERLLRVATKQPLLNSVPASISSESTSLIGAFFGGGGGGGGSGIGRRR